MSVTFSPCCDLTSCCSTSSDGLIARPAIATAISLVKPGNIITAMNPKPTGEDEPEVVVRAVRHALGSLGFDGVQGVRQGKVIELDLADGTTEDTVREMCEKLLANTVIESYSIELE